MSDKLLFKLSGPTTNAQVRETADESGADIASLVITFRRESGRVWVRGFVARSKMLIPGWEYWAVGNAIAAATGLPADSADPFEPKFWVEAEEIPVP